MIAGRCWVSCSTALSSKCKTLTCYCCQGSAKALIAGQHLCSWRQNASNHQHSQTHHALNHPTSPSSTPWDNQVNVEQTLLCFSELCTHGTGGAQWSPCVGGPTSQSSKHVAILGLQKLTVQCLPGNRHQGWGALEVIHPGQHERIRANRSMPDAFSKKTPDWCKAGLSRDSVVWLWKTTG